MCNVSALLTAFRLHTCVWFDLTFLSPLQRILEQKSWKDALAKATGSKLKDNPTLLRKSLKRDDRSKKRSKGQWTERVDKVCLTEAEAEA